MPVSILAVRVTSNTRSHDLTLVFRKMILTNIYLT